MKKTVACIGLAAALQCVAAADWSKSEWISVREAPVHDGAKDERAAPGTSWFARTFVNAGDVASAKWTVTGLGVFEAYVNGARVGDDFLKPGFTHYGKTKYAFTYDVTDLLRKNKGATNVLAAEVSSGWWRDKIVNYKGKKSAFRGELELVYADGRRETIGTKAAEWRSGVAGPVRAAGIFDGETYDARKPAPRDGKGLTGTTEVNAEFAGEILPTVGAETTLRRDLAMTRGPYALKKGETLVVDFGQNCAGVPEFRFKAPRGTVLTALPGEMLNDADKGRRGSDGPKGSVYRANLRRPDTCMRLDYTFAGAGVETYLPRFTFFGYRYLSITATDDVEIASVASIPVTSVTKEMETGKLEVGDASLNKFISNVYWGQLSNYLSVPTDCPQRNERLGWTADTQVFCEAGSWNADTRGFFRKYTRDLRDSQDAQGGYPSVAPYAQYGNETFKLGWADAGVIVPWTVWKHFGDTQILADNWDAMAKFVRKLDETKYDFEGKLGYIYADWLSYEKFETCGNKYGSWSKWGKDPDAMNYRRFLAACYWLYDAQLMAEMGDALGKTDEAVWFRASAERARAYIRERFLEKDGLLLKPMRDLQTACVFALKFDVVEGAARTATKNLLLKSIREHGDCLQTGFLGTSFLMEVLAKENAFDVAYTLLFQHRNPSWLYSVDQGATTVWERWNSYTKKDGFGPVGMNSFNHYAYGAVLAWIYRHAAGIACDPASTGFRKIVMAPQPDRRLGFVRASYRSAAGSIASAWRYEGDDWIWEFTIPAGTTARVVAPGRAPVEYGPGSHRIALKLPAPDAQGFIRTSGHDLLDEKNRKFFIRGVNLGNWLNPEGYMFGFLDSCNSARKMTDMFCKLVGPHETAKFWRAFKDNYVTEKDIAFIAATGANTVRLPFNYRSFTDEDYMGETGPGDGFARVDKLIGWCRAHGLRLILDMHAAPGGQTGDNIDDSYGYAWLFDKDFGAPYVRQYCEIWRTIAARYKDEPVVLGYDLMNEPISKSQDALADTKEWKRRLEAIQQEAVKAIREVDKNHVVMFAGSNWNTEFDMFKDFKFDSNMMFTCHHYRFGNPVYTNDMVCAYAAFGDKSGVPIFMGETGHNVPEWIKANRLAMEENNIGWTTWPYKWHGKAGQPAACFRTFKLPEGWTDVIRPFAEGKHDRQTAARAKILPDAKEALRLMKEYVENCRFENCTSDEAFLKAMGLKVPAAK